MTKDEMSAENVGRRVFYRSADGKKTYATFAGRDTDGSALLHFDFAVSNVRVDASKVNFVMEVRPL